MNKLLVIAVIAIVVLTYSVNAQISEDTLGQPLRVQIAADSLDTYSTPSVLTDTASTTAVLLAAQSGRREVEIRVNEASKSLWVSVGSTTATVSGSNCVLVTSTAPYKCKLDDTVPMAAIASEAFSYSFLQYK